MPTQEWTRDDASSALASGVTSIDASRMKWEVVMQALKKAHDAGRDWVAAVEFARYAENCALCMEYQEFCEEECPLAAIDLCVNPGSSYHSFVNALNERNYGQAVAAGTNMLLSLSMLVAQEKKDRKEMQA